MLSEICWVKPKANRLLVLSMGLLMAAVAAVVMLILFTSPDDRHWARGLFPYIYYIWIIFGAGGVAYYFYVVSKTELGTDGVYMYTRFKGRKLKKYSLKNALRGNNFIALGGTVIQTKVGDNFYCYDKDALEDVLFSKIDLGNTKDDGKILVQLVRRHSLPALLMLVWVIGGAFIFLL